MTRTKSRAVLSRMVAAPAAAVAVMALVGPGAGGAAAAGHRASTFGRTISVVAHGTRFDASKSNNWSGYNQGILETGAPFSSVSGSWVVPRARQHRKGQAEYSSTWIGIGGGCLDVSCQATDSTLIQAGTEQDVSKDGAASYSAWWELVPAPSVTAPVRVHPGDRIDCSISQVVPGVWSIRLRDATDHQGFSETLPYPSDETTAEWIVETPLVLATSGSGLAALPDLGVVRFSAARVNGKPAQLRAVQAVQLVSSAGRPLATPSAPSRTGSFSDCTWASRCTR